MENFVQCCCSVLLFRNFCSVLLTVLLMNERDFFYFPIKVSFSRYQKWQRKWSDDDDDELFLWYGWPTKGVKPYFLPGPLPEILTIANLRRATSRTWTRAKPEFRLFWMKLYSSDNHYTTAPQNHFSGNYFLVRTFSGSLINKLMEVIIAK